MSSSLSKELLLAALGPEVDLLIGHASFESRSLALADTLKDRCRSAVVFSVDQFAEQTESNLNEFCEIIQNTTSHELSYSHPVQSADAMRKAFSESFDPKLRTVVDITTFTRENLLIFMKVISSSCNTMDLSNLYFVYNCASEMDEGWLSRGISEQRSILGYSGEMLPSRKTHLIVLMGFEVDRAKYLIDAYEPYSVSIGFGHQDESISEDFHKRNMASIESLIDSYPKSFISDFSFSLVDPRAAADSLSVEAQKYDEFNVILAPQNNKISSVAAGILALSNTDLQVVYTQMEEYNYEAYSKPSQQFYLFGASELYAPF